MTILLWTHTWSNIWLICFTYTLGNYIYFKYRSLSEPQTLSYKMVLLESALGANFFGHFTTTN